LPPPPSARQLELVNVSRSHIEQHGWPRSWRQLREDAEACVLNLQSGAVPDLCIQRMAAGEAAQKAYQTLDRAYFRHGGDDRAYLLAQAW
jgi:hypothetical protein